MPPIEIAVTEIASPSTSESLFKTPFAAATDNNVSSKVLFTSGFASGLSLIGFTVISNVDVVVVIPSETV